MNLQSAIALDDETEYGIEYFSPNTLELQPSLDKIGRAA